MHSASPTPLWKRASGSQPPSGGALGGTAAPAPFAGGPAHTAPAGDAAAAAASTRRRLSSSSRASRASTRCSACSKCTRSSRTPAASLTPSTTGCACACTDSGSRAPAGATANTGSAVAASACACSTLRGSSARPARVAALLSFPGAVRGVGARACMAALGGAPASASRPHRPAPAARPPPHTAAAAAPAGARASVTSGAGAGGCLGPEPPAKSRGGGAGGSGRAGGRARGGGAPPAVLALASRTRVSWDRSCSGRRGTNSPTAAASVTGSARPASKCSTMRMLAHVKKCLLGAGRTS
mmetsp:Transcript_99607/g.277316  ORF Transcript_99607/g.277316 Transcript_99607/m.277316 type:complete len:298 (-) Transcript_99607:1260-2153(-)